MFALNQAAHDVFGASAIQFLSANMSTLAPIDTLISAHEDRLAKYVDELAPIDPRYRRMLGWARSVWRNENLLTQKELDSSEIGSFLRQNYAFHQLGHIRKFPNGVWFLTVLLDPEAKGGFDTEYEAPLGKLHNALCSLSQLRSEKLSLVSTEAAYDSRAVFLDRRLRVLHIGELAERAIKEDWIDAKNLALCARSVEDDKRLQGALGLLSGLPVGAVGPVSLLLQSQTGGPGGSITLHRIGDRHPHDFFGRQPTIVAILKSNRSPELSVSSLTDNLKITEAEAKAVYALMCNQTISEYADSAGIRTDTVRKSLKAIFLKTRTRGQVELLRMVQRLYDDTY